MNFTVGRLTTRYGDVALTLILSESEAADGVFADAAEVEFAVAFDHVGDLRVAIGGAVLEVRDDAALRIDGDYERITLGRGLERFRKSKHDLAQEWMR